MGEANFYYFTCLKFFFLFCCPFRRCLSSQTLKWTDIMEDVETWKDWTTTMETMLTDQGAKKMKNNLTLASSSSSLLMNNNNNNKLGIRSAEKEFGEIVLGTESEMRVEESLFDRLSNFTGKFTINDIDLKGTEDLFSETTATKNAVVDNNNDGDAVGQMDHSGLPSLGDIVSAATPGNDVSSHFIEFFSASKAEDPLPSFSSESSHLQHFESNQTATASSSSHKTPLPPFPHFRLPPPPPPPCISSSGCADAIISLITDHLLTHPLNHHVVMSPPDVHSDVVVAADAYQLSAFALPSFDSSPSKTLSPPIESEAVKTTTTRFPFSNCSSAPGAIQPFKPKGKSGSRLFSKDRRRATLDTNPTVPESWVSPQSALLTVLTRDLYPPASELVLPPPKGVAVDLERYYAVFLPKNLSDDYAKGVDGDGGGSVNVSSIPSLLGRSASTESLHKDRLLPLLDDFFDCGDLEFSTRNIFRYSSNSSFIGGESGGGAGGGKASSSSRHSPSNPSSEVDDDVGFYLDSNSP